MRRYVLEVTFFTKAAATLFANKCACSLMGMCDGCLDVHLTAVIHAFAKYETDV